MSKAKDNLKTYAKPLLVKHDNVKDLTRECANWQCSVTVPAGP